MALTLTGGSASISTSEYFLASNSTTATYQTTDAVMQTFVDLTNLAAGDQFRVRVYEKINGATARTIYDATFTGAQAESCVTPRVVVGDGWEVSVQKIAGTDRTIPWSIRLQTSDAFDATAVLAAIAAVQADTDDIQTRLPAALDASGFMKAQVKGIDASTITATSIASNAITSAKVATDAIGAAQLAADAITEIQSGLATSANQSTIIGYIDTEVAAIKAKTDNLPSDPADASDIAAAFASVAASIAALPSAATIATAVWAYTIETGVSALQAVRGILAVSAGQQNDDDLADGSGTFFAPDGVTARITWVISNGIKSITRNL